MSCSRVLFSHSVSLSSSRLIMPLEAITFSIQQSLFCITALATFHLATLATFHFGYISLCLSVLHFRSNIQGLNLPGSIKMYLVLGHFYLTVFLYHHLVSSCRCRPHYQFYTLCSASPLWLHLNSSTLACFSLSRQSFFPHRCANLML